MTTYKKSSFVNVDVGDINTDSLSDKKRKRFTRLFFDDIKDFYRFGVWAKETLSLYQEGIGDYENISDLDFYKHVIIYLNYIQSHLNEYNLIERSEWNKRLSSNIRYGKKLIKIKNEK